MLDHRQLLLIQAALKFFDEEMSPHDPSLTKAYFEKTLKPHLGREEIGKLRDTLSDCRVRYLICELEDDLILHRNLFHSVSEARSSCAPAMAIATVLLPADPRSEALDVLKQF